MKSRTNIIQHSALAGLLLGICLAMPVFAGNKPAPGQSAAFGKTLAQWEDLYVRWLIGDITIPSDANGNPVVNGVVLLPIPPTPGDGTPGHQDVTLNSGQPFFLPLLQEAGTSYTDGTPPDPFLDLTYFASYDVSLQIDGVTVVNNGNIMNYFTQFNFTPPIPLNFFNFDSAIWFQGFNIAHSPLPVGTHTIRLDETAGEPLPPNFGSLTLEYHNTWTITVLP